MAGDVTTAADFRLTTAPPPPAWARGAVIYQVFPDRFARSAGADVVTEDTKPLEKDAHTEHVPTHVEGTKFVAAFAPRSRVKVGDQVEVVVDTERVHSFDPETGDAIRR